MTAHRVLFVDDDTRVLDGLARLLRPLRHQWEVSTALGPEAALAMLSERPFDIVVSDMQMPSMDGAAFLTHVQQAYPGIVRMVLSGQTDLATALRTVPVAHQFLSKPCDAKQLTEALEGACRIHSVQHSDAVRRAVGGVRTLPSLPSVCIRLGALIAKEDVTMAEIAGVLQQDVGMVAKVMQLANSPFFGVRRKPASIREALTYLGLNVIRDLVLSIGAITAFEAELRRVELDLGAFQADALRTAALAKRLVGPGLADQAFTAGVLHDVGKLVLASRVPEAFLAATTEARASGRPLHEVERELNGYTHAEAGGMLVAIWGFGWPTVDAVAHHCDADQIVHSEFGLVDAIYIASRMAKRGANGIVSPPPEYLAALGVAERLPEWQSFAEQLRDTEAP